MRHGLLVLICSCPVAISCCLRNANQESFAEQDATASVQLVQKAKPITIYFNNNDPVRSADSLRIGEKHYSISSGLKLVLEELADRNPTKLFIVIGRSPPPMIDEYVKQLTNFAESKSIPFVVTDLS